MSVEVFHLVEGPADAPALVFSNSLGTTHRMWDAQAEALSGSFRVIRYDARGHGSSPVPPGPYSMADLGDDVLALLDRLGLERASFCGLSIGGMTGMWLGVNAPERIDRLALCCTAPHLPPREQWIERAAVVRSDGMAAVTEAALDRWFTPQFAQRSPLVIERFRQMLLSNPPEGYAGCCEALGEFDLWDRIGDIRAPTLIVAGADDPVGTPEIAREMDATIPDSRLVIVPEARHLANVPHPELFTSALREHLQVEVPR